MKIMLEKCHLQPDIEKRDLKSLQEFMKKANHIIPERTHSYQNKSVIEN